MKTPPAIGLMFLSSALYAAETPMPAFPEAKIGLPPLSLGEAAKARLPAPFDGAALRTSRVEAAARGSRKVSHMPVLRPEECDPAMVVAPPNGGVDYTLKVKRPEVERAE